MKCDKCKEKAYSPLLQREILSKVHGSGSCNKHGKYAFINKNENGCRVCAKEKNICISCGEILKK